MAPEAQSNRGPRSCSEKCRDPLGFCECESLFVRLSVESCACLVKAAVTHWVNTPLADLPSKPFWMWDPTADLNTNKHDGQIRARLGIRRRRAKEAASHLRKNNGVTQ